MSNPDTPSVGFFTKWTLVLSILLGLSIVTITAIVLGVKPAFMKMERQAMEQSHQYTAATESMLLKLVAEYDELEVTALEADEAGRDKVAAGIRSQQKSILARIKVEVQRIDPDTVPQHIKDFLEKHQ